MQKSRQKKSSHFAVLRSFCFSSIVAEYDSLPEGPGRRNELYFFTKFRVLFQTELVTLEHLFINNYIRHPDPEELMGRIQFFFMDPSIRSG